MTSSPSSPKRQKIDPDLAPLPPTTVANSSLASNGDHPDPLPSNLLHDLENNNDSDDDISVSAEGEDNDVPEDRGDLVGVPWPMPRSPTATPNPRWSQFLQLQKSLGVPVSSLLESFGLSLSEAVDHGATDDTSIWAMLEMIDPRDLGIKLTEASRSRLSSYNTIDDAVSLIANSRRILVLTGAGISVSAGIPDFRSKEGVYAMVGEEFAAELPRPELIFDIRYFRLNHAPFFQFAKELLPGKFQPCVAHHFIRLLDRRGYLLRNYTQNIDTLEDVAGISDHRLVQCHGSFKTASCIDCHHQLKGEEVFDDMRQGRVPRCQHQVPSTIENDTSTRICDGIIKPDIVFFGEDLSDRFYSMVPADIDAADLLIVMGSSLKVAPVCKIPRLLPPNIPQILINRERVARPHEFDIELLGDCDVVLSELCRRLQWDLPHLLNRADEAEHTVLNDGTLMFQGGVSPRDRWDPNSDDDDSYDSDSDNDESYDSESESSKDDRMRGGEDCVGEQRGDSDDGDNDEEDHHCHDDDAIDNACYSDSDDI